MDYPTARQFLIDQANVSGQNLDAFLIRLKEKKTPVPGQVTNLLLALKVVFEGLRTTTHLDRELVFALYLLSYETRQHYEAGRQAGVNWPPLLNEDLRRISRAVKSIFAGVWHTD